MRKAIEVAISNFSLLARLDALSNELEFTWDELIEIAIEKFLDDFNQDIALFTCRKSIVKRQYKMPEAGDIF